MGVAKNRNTVLSGVLARVCALGVAPWCATHATAGEQGPPTPAAVEVAAVVPPLRVVVSIPPLAGLVRPVVEATGPGTTIETLIPPGVSEHGYEPTPAQVAALARADLVVLVGLGLESGIERAARQRAGGGPIMFADVVGVAQGDATKQAAGREAADHRGDDQGHHDHADGDRDHGGNDPHLWLDPSLALKLVSHLHDCMRAYVIQVQAPRDLTPEQRRARILASMEPRIDSRTLSVQERAVSAAFEPIVLDLLALDAEYVAALAPHKGKAVVVAHDAWGHLGRRYGIEFVPIAGLNAGEPTPDALARAAEVVKRRGLTSIYVEPQSSPAAAQAIANATGATIRTLDPLGSGDYFAMMRANLAALVAGFEGSPRVGAPALPVAPAPPTMAAPPARER